MLSVILALGSASAAKVAHGCRPSTNATVRSAAITQAGGLRAKNASFCARCTLPGETSPRCVSAMHASPKGSGGVNFFLQEPDHEVGIVNLFLTLLALRRYPQRRPVFFDIGMNSGFFSNLMAAQGAEVHAFETQPKCFEYASSALAAGGRWPAVYDGSSSEQATAPSVFLYNAGLTDKAGTITQSTLGCDGSNRALTQVSSSLKHIKAWGGGQKRVPTFVVDDSMQAECAPHIFAIKMDTEGAEIKILRGMQRLLATRKVANLVVEILPPNWVHYGVSLAEGAHVLRTLSTLGFKAYLMWDHRHDREGLPLAGTGPDLAPDAHPAGARCKGSSATLRPIVDWDALVSERVEHRAGGNIWFTRQFS